MKKIKHFVITRFLCNSSMNLGNKVFDKDMLENGIKLLKTFLYPSLLNQSNKNFEWIILLHKDVNMNYISELLNLKADFKITFIKVDNWDMTNMKMYINAWYRQCEWLITSRIDYDDQIYYNAIQDIHDSIKCNHPIYIYTWDNYVEHNIELELYENTKNKFKNSGGGMSILLTLVMNTSKINKPINIHQTGNHTKCANYILNNYKNIGLTTLDYNPLVSNDYNDIIPLMYTIHKNNDSSKLEKFIENPKMYKNFNYNKFFNINIK